VSPDRRSTLEIGLAALVLGLVGYGLADELIHFGWHLAYGSAAGLVLGTVAARVRGEPPTGAALWALAGYAYMVVPDALWVLPKLWGGSLWPHQPCGWTSFWATSPSTTGPTPRRWRSRSSSGRWRCGSGRAPAAERGVEPERHLQLVGLPRGPQNRAYDDVDGDARIDPGLTEPAAAGTGSSSSTSTAAARLDQARPATPARSPATAALEGAQPALACGDGPVLASPAASGCPGPGRSRGPRVVSAADR
jgi:hypothetical protein